MKSQFFLLIFFCLLRALPSQAQTKLYLKDSEGNPQSIVLNQTKVKIFFNDSLQQALKGKISGLENQCIYLQCGDTIPLLSINQISMKGAKNQTHKALGFYYFGMLNANALLLFWSAGYGLTSIGYQIGLLVLSPVTLVLIPVIVSKAIRKYNPIIIPIKGNF